MKVLLNKKGVDGGKCFVEPVQLDDGVARDRFGMPKIPGAEIYHRCTALAGKNRETVGTTDNWTMRIEEAFTSGKKGADILVGN